LREDKGALLENFVFRRLLEMYSGDEIHFWRTQQHEVDFVVTPMLGKPFSLEVKWDVSRVGRSNYGPFKETYPEIPLLAVGLENILQLRVLIAKAQS
jgi:hypothetical protein